MRANKRHIHKLCETELCETLLCVGVGQKTNFECICNSTRKKNSFVQQPHNVSIQSPSTLRNFSHRGKNLSILCRIRVLRYQPPCCYFSHAAVMFEILHLSFHALSITISQHSNTPPPKKKIYTVFSLIYLYYNTTLLIPTCFNPRDHHHHHYHHIFFLIYDSQNSVRRENYDNPKTNETPT